MTTRILTLFLISGVLAFSGTAPASARDNGGFSNGEGITGNSYAAFDDPNPNGFDPSAIEPAAGDEEPQATEDAQPAPAEEEDIQKEPAPVTDTPSDDEQTE